MPPHASPAEIYQGLRHLALETPPAFPLPADPEQPFGVLMEMDHPPAVVTLTSFVSGDASLYFSTGGGIIGGVGHESVQKAAQAFVGAAAHFVAAMQPTRAFPAPGPGRTRFYVRTGNGVLTAEADTQDLGNRRSPLTPLFFAGQGVITALRLVTEKQGR